jgi:hypothetical protein
MLPYKQSRAHAQRTCKNHTANIMPPFLDTDLAADWPEDATEHHAHHFFVFSAFDATDIPRLRLSEPRTSTSRLNCGCSVTHLMRQHPFACGIGHAYSEHPHKIKMPQRQGHSIHTRKK